MTTDMERKLAFQLEHRYLARARCRALAFTFATDTAFAFAVLQASEEE